MGELPNCFRVTRFELPRRFAPSIKDFDFLWTLLRCLSGLPETRSLLALEGLPLRILSASLDSALACGEYDLLDLENGYNIKKFTVMMALPLPYDQVVDIHVTSFLQIFDQRGWVPLYLNAGDKMLRVLGSGKVHNFLFYKTADTFSLEY